MTSATRLTPIFVSALLAMIVLVLGGLAPRPEGSTSGRRWLLDTRFDDVRVMGVQTSAGPRTFYYMSFKAVNRTGRDQILAPTFDLVDGDGRISRAGKDVPAEAYAAAMARLNNPLLKDPVSTIGPIGTGEENAVEGLVVWSCDDLTPGPITIYAAGFSGETAAIQPPGEGQRLVILRKTRELRFADPGDLSGRRDEPLGLIEANWVMR
ncbi:MAG: hypothetical protein MUE97_02295 [Phycisphaerales bacterium]|jgi:hypothetical protein|nr:hypothetical protein [Phycisphaerales bacterium]